ncbi:MAG TPA: type II toxin-antitoxin system HicA family toxin [Candidatus Nanoarchaeia archaeon]|nr:type II toxin-antitoxin system HicA family toxin [Candidatus Nanoarchaeia archaeon]
MTKLPRVSGKEVLKVLGKIGYYVRDQKGSHIHLRHNTKPPLTVPMHDELAPGTLRSIIRDAGLTVEEFLKLL